MPTYRAKPVEIQAIQWTGSNQAELKAFGAEIRDHEAIAVSASGHREVVSVPQVYDVLQDTWVNINSLDYIIKGTKGEFYPCDSEVFDRKYELIDGRHG